MQETLPAINTETLVQVVNTAPETLAKNTISHDNAYQYGKTLLERAEQSGMNDALDGLMAKYQEKLRVTYKTMSDRRKPFTQLVDEIKKRFTSLENDISSQNKSSVYVLIQNRRNEYASKKIEERKRAEAAARTELMKKEELIRIKKDVETAVNNFFYNALTKASTALNTAFEGLTLVNIDEGEKVINGCLSNQLDQKEYEKFNPSISHTLLTQGDIDKEIADFKTPIRYKDYNSKYSNHVSQLKIELIGKLASKKSELQEIATIEKTNKAEADRLKQEAEARKKAEEQRIRLQEAESRKKAEEEANAKASAAKVDAAITVQTDLFSEAPKVKSGCEIIIKNPVAYALLFNFWFEKEGRNLPVDKIEKMTIGRIKKYCEEYSLKNEEKIQSDLLEYKETYKAK